MAVSFSILVKTNLQVSNLKDKTNSKTLLSESEIFTGELKCESLAPLGTEMKHFSILMYERSS